MSKDNDKSFGFLETLGAILIAVGVGYVIYRIGKKVYKYHKESGENEVVSYDKEDIISDYYSMDKDIVIYES